MVLRLQRRHDAICRSSPWAASSHRPRRLFVVSLSYSREDFALAFPSSARTMDRRLVALQSSSATPSLLPSQPRTILEEEEYESILSHIVTRDYFPSLPSLRRDAEILDARSRGDMAGAVAARRRARAMELLEEKERMEDVGEDERAMVADNNSNNNYGESMDGVGLRVRPRQLKHESITGFHARVTSEDNVEFESNQERERKEREVILGVVYASRADKCGRLMIESHINGGDETNGDGNECDKRLHYNRDWCDTPIGLSSDLYDAPPQGLRITNGKSTAASNDNGIGRNGLFFQPRDKRLCVISEARGSSGTFLALENDSMETKRIENGENKSGESDNLLMPPPPARLMSDTDKTSMSSSNAKMPMSSCVDRRHQLVEYLPKQSLANIHPPATRFPYQNESRLPSSNSNLGTIIPSVSRGIVNRNGSFSTTDASDTTDLDEPPRQLDTERAARKRARDRENETFVAMTPLIRPGDGGRGDAGGLDEPIMTWGDVISTPLVLGGGSAIDARISSSVNWEPSHPPPDDLLPAPAFDVIDSNHRETLARRAERRLVNRAKTYRSAGSVSSYKESDDESIHSSRSTRSTRSTRSMSSSVTNPMDRSASLTPAARALLDAQNMARQSKKKANSISSGRTLSSIFSGSRDSFGTSLRASYTPDLTKGKKKTKGDSSLRRASSGATPRCH